MVSRSKLLVRGQQDMPGERRHHRTERRCGCKGIVLPVLNSVSHNSFALSLHGALHRLKLVTGVDISTRPVRRSGREGKAKKRTSLRAAAEVKRVAFRRSITMLNDSACNPVYLCASAHRTDAMEMAIAQALRVRQGTCNVLRREVGLGLASGALSFFYRNSTENNIIPPPSDAYQSKGDSGHSRTGISNIPCLFPHQDKADGSNWLI